MNIAIYGTSGSGKSTVSRYLAETYQYIHCHPGARCRELAIELFDDDSKAVLNALSDCLRSIDATVWIRTALRGLSKSSAIVFDGMRYEQDFVYFQNHSFSTWCVTSDSQTRRERLTLRGQAFAASDEEHASEVALQRSHFDVVLINDGDKAQLFTQIDAALRRISSTQ